MLRSFVGLVVALGASLPLGAQGTDHSHMDMAGMEHHQASLSPTASREIDSVRAAVRPLGSTAAANAAGFSPVFGWIPTMGVHWVNRERMTKGAQSSLASPSNLMFSRIAGRDSLVGAAYAYFAPASDSTPPAVFDGAPAWHEHADLAPAGQRLVMLHVWFVPSPDGPFAGTNPNLPFWAAGLGAVDASRMHDPAYASRVRRAALALAEVADSTALFPRLKGRPEVRQAIAVRRDSVRALVPAIAEAQRTHDAAGFDRLTEQAAGQWDAMRATYLASAQTEAGKRRIEEYIAMVTSDHGHHHD